ncbi:MAG: anti-sigma factor [Actinophytocola sp.]|uniref:anti-sigma factor n=1 Tax=Actinophytocola sp. TaxID=1872138 RepID=UPI001322565E|nr:zf-HC2 domain-containing protein [Actinophytocola sp.]MPZ79430.1 anti-sigma factor [Actinophytocola sp.]
MNSVEHDGPQLVAYALGALDPAEQSVVHAHVAGCAECQREVQEIGNLRVSLDQVPPEAFLDGPPADDILLQKTLRRARGDAPPEIRRRSPLILVAAAVAVAIALGGGVLIGRQTAPDQVAALPANAVTEKVTDSGTGATMAVTMVPKAGWVTVHADVSGLPKGLDCELFVVPRDGDPVLAGSWKVSATGEHEGTPLDGAALVDPAEVESVRVVTTDGDTMVTVPL